MISDDHKEMLDLIVAAAKDDALVLLRCDRKDTGEERTGLCAMRVSKDALDRVDIAPLAELPALEPFDTWHPPEGGSVGVPKEEEDDVSE